LFNGLGWSWRTDTQPFPVRAETLSYPIRIVGKEQRTAVYIRERQRLGRHKGVVKALARK